MKIDKKFKHAEEVLVIFRSKICSGHHYEDGAVGFEFPPTGKTHIRKYDDSEVFRTKEELIKYLKSK